MATARQTARSGKSEACHEHAFPVCINRHRKDALGLRSDVGRRRFQTCGDSSRSPWTSMLRRRPWTPTQYPARIRSPLIPTKRGIAAGTGRSQPSGFWQRHPVARTVAQSQASPALSRRPWWTDRNVEPNHPPRLDGSRCGFFNSANSPAVLDQRRFRESRPRHGSGIVFLHRRARSTRASAAAVYVSWDNADPTDYLAGLDPLDLISVPRGYVITRNAATITGFWKSNPSWSGPEYRSGRPTFQSALLASYQGLTEGLFALQWGADGPHAAPGSNMIGGFKGIDRS